MQPPTKSQIDIDVENPTLDASDGALLERLDENDVIENKDMARQEFKDDADINHMLAKFGVVPPRGTPTFGEWDETLDLQTAIDSVRDARTAFQKLPKELTEKFRSMDDLLQAIESGSLVIKDETPPTIDNPPPQG